MKLLNFTIIKLTICLITGIVIAHSFSLNYSISLYATIGLIIILGCYWLFIKQSINHAPYFALISFLCMAGIGINAYHVNNEKIKPLHYTNHYNETDFADVTFKIKERLKPDLYNKKYIVSVVTLDDKNVIGKLLVNIKKDSLNIDLPIDAILFTSSQLYPIPKPLNPHQFDYSRFLKLKQVHHQLYIEDSQFILISNSATSVYGLADQLRTTINKKLISAGFKDDTLSIINALLLGQRQTIDKSIYNNYVNSGTIHILAVSGLHVGILLLILNFIFRPLLYLRHGRFLRPLIIIILLWSFAVIAGLSPSVTRAVAMFSIISVAMHLKRPANIYNTLAISAFFILLIKPTFLFEVGFQMSYLAVLGIVSIQPIVYKLWQPKYWIINKLWQIFTVTLAAQIGVVPISLYYFHQFPGLFFVSNLVVIPFLGLILGFGLLVIVLALTNLLHHSLVSAYDFIITSLNNFIAWVAKFEDFLFKDIPFTLTQVLLSYLVIIALVQTYKFRTFKWAATCLIAIIGLQATQFYNSNGNTNEELVVFNKSRYTIIGQKQGSRLLVNHNLDAFKLKNDNIIKNYKVGEMLSELRTDSLQALYQLKNQKLLVIDSLGIYKNLSFKPEYILLTNSPKINLNRLIDSIQPKQIIADASNFKSYAKRWKTTCIKRKIPFHYTNEKGAFILE